MKFTAAVFAIALAACTREPATTADTTTAAATAPTTLAPRDAAFVTVALRHSDGHVRLATSAAAQSENPEVRQLAADVIADHNLLIDRLTRVADAHNLPVPTDAHPDLLAIDDRFTTMVVSDLERAYVNALLNVYPPLMRHYADAAHSGASDEVRSLAATAHEQLTEHHARTQAIQAVQAGASALVPIAPGAPGLQRPVP